MLACTSTNALYERARPPANLPHQPKFDLHHPTARTSSNQSRRPVRNNVALFKTKLSPCPRKSCHPIRNKLVIAPDFGLIHIVLRPAPEGLPATWPRCTKHQNSFPTVFFRPLTVRLPHPEHLPSNCFSPTTSSQAPNQPAHRLQANLLTPKPARCVLLTPSSDQTVTSCSAHSSRFGSPIGSTSMLFVKFWGLDFDLSKNTINGPISS